MTTEKCKTCDGKLQMYYKLWCPRCDKPQRKPAETLNLIQALDHIEAITGDVNQGDFIKPGYKPGYRERMWSKLGDMDYIRHNDSYSLFNRLDDSWWGTNVSDQTKADFNLFCDTFDIDEDTGVILDISW